MFGKIYRELIVITHYLDRICGLLEAIAAHEGAKEVFYFCNGERSVCNKKHCFKNGHGGCQYTNDVKYAKNFKNGPSGRYFETWNLNDKEET